MQQQEFSDAVILRNQLVRKIGVRWKRRIQMQKLQGFVRPHWIDPRPAPLAFALSGIPPAQRCPPVHRIVDVTEHPSHSCGRIDEPFEHTFDSLQAG